jgi:hypothetical protein
MPEEVEVVAIASPTEGNTKKLADKYDISRVFTDYKQMLTENDIEMVSEVELAIYQETEIQLKSAYGLKDRGRQHCNQFSHS